MKRYTAKDTAAGMRLDIFVNEQLPLLSRAAVQKLCQSDKVLVNGEKVKNGYKLRTNDKVDVQFDEKLLEVPSIELPVLYEDDDCIVINKPEGILTHSKGAYNPETSVASFISTKVHGIESNRAGIVHRLDRGTSGIIICAKHPLALKHLQKQFSMRKVKKSYRAITSGKFEEMNAVIDMPIARHPRKPQTFRVSKMGKPANTQYHVSDTSGEYSLVDLQPFTGRTHQLRVHLSYIGHPIVGDRFYGGEPADRLMLHAFELEITLPNREKRTFTAPPPASFTDYWKLRS